MKTGELLLTGLHITEDEYRYNASFILSGNGVSLEVELSDLDVDSRLKDIHDFFTLEETLPEMRRILMDRVLERAGMSSRITQGERYGESITLPSKESSTASLNRA